METKTRATILLRFDENEAKLIDTLVREQVGDRTIRELLDEFSFVFDWYKALFNMLPKIWHHEYMKYDSSEYNVLSCLISKAYNDGQHENQKDMLQNISDAMDAQRDAFMAI